MTKVEYFYGPNGQRAKRIDYNAGAIAKINWYIRDASGAIMRIYEMVGDPNGTNSGINAKETPVYASGRIGVAYSTSSGYEYRYEISDHLGNVRAVLEDDGSGSTKVLTYSDYYPFGWTMPGRNAGDDQYRFGYQGQFTEKDEKTGWTAFDLRMYDGRIGRWMTIDPYEQYWSPYLAMGNNPISSIDRDGGFNEYNVYIDPETNQITGYDYVSNKGGDSQDYLNIYKGPGVIKDNFLGTIVSDNNFFSSKGGYARAFPGVFVQDYSTLQLPPIATGSLSSTDNPLEWLIGVGELKAIAKASGTLLSFAFIKTLGDDVAAKTSTKLLPMLSQTTRQSVLSSAQVLNKNGLSVAGRALQKHAGRPGPFSSIKFSHKTGSQQGLDVGCSI